MSGETLNGLFLLFTAGLCLAIHLITRAYYVRRINAIRKATRLALQARGDK